MPLSKQKKNKLIVVFSGNNQSGKLTASNFTLAEYLNKKIGKKRFSVQKINKEYHLIDGFNEDQIIPISFPNEVASHIFNTYDVKVYSFTDPIKDICINYLGLDPSQCYGLEDDRASNTHLSYDSFFNEIREKYSKPRRGSTNSKIATGNMNANEVINVIQNEIFRRIDPNSIARALYNTIEREKYGLAIVYDCTTKPEVTLGTEIGAKVIKLLKESSHKELQVHELDDLPLGEYSLCIDNQNMSVDQMFEKIRKPLNEWFYARKVI